MCTPYEELKARFDNLSESEQIELHNKYCENNHDMDNYIYSMDDFENVFYGTEKFELVRMVIYGDFNPSDDWFSFNGYGNLISFGYARRLEDHLLKDDICYEALDYPNLYDELYGEDDIPSDDD